MTAKILAVAVVLGLLAGCGKWQVKVDLKPEEKAAIEAEVASLNDEIKNFQPTPEQQIPMKQITAVTADYEKLGRLDKAIKVYKDIIDAGKKSIPSINNLGRLYEKVGEYDLAVEQYKKLIDEYFETSYLYDITWAYIRAAQASKGAEAVEYRKKAEKVFNAWQNEFKKTDEQTQEAIKKLREAEKAAKS